MRSLEDASVNGKRVLIWLGLNAPMEERDGKQVVVDDSRLQRILPTLHFLINRFAKVIIISKLGRPNGEIVPELSMKPMYEHLSKLLGREVKFMPELFGEATAQAINEMQEGEIVGLENVRFDKRDEANSRTFARELAAYGDLYVNEDLSTSQREEATVVAITEFLPSYAGLLLEREVGVITNLTRHPATPFIVIIGGAKIAGDKLPVMNQLINRADRILVGGGVANTLLAAQGMDVKKSLYEPECLDEARGILKKGKGKIVLPVDSIWDNDAIMDIGPKTVALFESYIKNAKTIFWNGNLGKTEEIRFRNSDKIAQALANTDGTTIVGGGDTGAIIDRLGLQSELSFVSSGGGATLELLAGKTLPGIKALG